MNCFTPLFQANLSLNLIPVSLRELLYLEQLPCDIYQYSEGRFEIAAKAHSSWGKKEFLHFLDSKHHTLFVREIEYLKLIELQQKNLLNVTRSLSIGDPLEKGKRQLSLLSINMKYLYNDPANDDFLNRIYQCLRNLENFLSQNLHIQKDLVNDYMGQKHHYIYAQPLLSSLFLLGILRQTQLFTNQEILELFVTSFFKDIGMALVPAEQYEQKELSPSEKELVAKHATHSVEILQNRIPLSASRLKIIEHHHVFGLLNQEKEFKEIALTGIETMLISITDIIAAMISKRPYRQENALYDALEFIKLLISDQYPQEFKLIVNYFKQFFMS